MHLSSITAIPTNRNPQELPMHPLSAPVVPTTTNRSILMTSLHKFLCCVLLALPAGSAFSAVVANPTLAVNITVNIDATVRIEWTNGTNVTTARTWTLSNVDLDSVIASTGNVANGTDSTNSLYVTNRSQVPADLAIGVSAQTGWTHAAIAGHGPNNIYTIRAATVGGTPVASTVDAAGALVLANDFTLALPVSGSTVQLSDELAKDASQALDLEFITPVNVTTNSASMTVTVTGSVD
jgi:hypothetical protein